MWETAGSLYFSLDYAKVTINFYAYNNAGGKGIACGLGNVMKTRDGEPLVTRLTGDEFDI